MVAVMCTIDHKRVDETTTTFVQSLQHKTSSMGLFNLGGANKEQRASIAEYSASLDAALKDDQLDGGMREQLESEKRKFDGMSEKEQKRWVDFKRGQNKQGTLMVDLEA